MMDTLKRLLEQAKITKSKGLTLTEHNEILSGDDTIVFDDWHGHLPFVYEQDAALIVYLVNNAPKLLELWEAAQAIYEVADYGEPTACEHGCSRQHINIWHCDDCWNRLRDALNSLKEQELDDDNSLQG